MRWECLASRCTTTSTRCTAELLATRPRAHRLRLQLAQEDIGDAVVVTFLDHE